MRQQDKQTVLLYAGTTQGRILAQILAQNGIPCVVCVATEYGETVMPQEALITLAVGRQNLEEMKLLMAKERFLAVVDATHPFAVEVTKQVKEAASVTGLPYFRLKRDTDCLSETDKKLLFYENAQSCAEDLAKREGNILLTTGTKDLAAYAANPDLRGRLYARVLPNKDSLLLCEQQGLVGKQIIAMQGPFSVELNVALLKQYQIRYLVTKQSGTTGGVLEKRDAAVQAGVQLCVIKNPDTQEGDTLPGVLRQIAALFGKNVQQPMRNIALIGTGMGTEATLTMEAKQAIEQAKYLFGAPRLLASFATTQQVWPYYLAQDILPILQRLHETDGGSGDVAILFSGDSGFYSGTQKLLEQLRTNGFERIRILPGISSVSALSAKVGISWQDAKLLSLHGKAKQDWQTWVGDIVRSQQKTILLLSDKQQVICLCETLADSNLSDCTLFLGWQLSNPQERVEGKTVFAWLEELADWPDTGLYTAMVICKQQQPRQLTYGFRESAFVRGKVPMTKEEVRSIVIGKLNLQEGAVVYDIGSGTGSVAVELALLSPFVQVYALECSAAGMALIEENCARYQRKNIKPIWGMAPDAMRDLPGPTHAFIGGSKGKLREILQQLYDKNPQMRVVMTAISLQTISAFAKVPAWFSLAEYEIVQVQVSRAERIGRHDMLQAENPITICSLTFQPQEEITKGEAQ